MIPQPPTPNILPGCWPYICYTNNHTNSQLNLQGQLLKKAGEIIPVSSQNRPVIANFSIFRDLQEIGIVSASEQKHLIDQARLLHASKTRPVGYSQRCEMSLERGTIIGV